MTPQDCLCLMQQKASVVFLLLYYMSPIVVLVFKKEVTVGDSWFIFKGSPFFFLDLTDFFEGKMEEEGKREREDYKYTIYNIIQYNII